MIDLREQPWWTEADRAELDLHVHEMVTALGEHRQAGCPVCIARYPVCTFVRERIERVIAWRDDRVLRSRAAWLRGYQDRYEYERAELAWYESFQAPRR